jgi:hypothetical protein
MDTLKVETEDVGMMLGIALSKIDTLKEENNFLKTNQGKLVNECCVRGHCHCDDKNFTQTCNGCSKKLCQLCKPLVDNYPLCEICVVNPDTNPTICPLSRDQGWVRVY